MRAKRLTPMPLVIRLCLCYVNKINFVVLRVTQLRTACVVPL